MNSIPAIAAGAGRDPRAVGAVASARRRGKVRPDAPQRLAGYQLEAVLSRGRRSIVYLAREPRHDRTVALKVAQRAHLEAGGPARDFGRDFTVLTALAHPHVIQAFDHGVSGDKAFLGMEYAAGGAMAQHCGPVLAARAASLLHQAATALAWVHQQGWVHRDVKPANVLLRADGSLALGDFGCARRRGEVDLLPTGAVVGTPKYAAPEQSQGAPADPAADVYSLGVLLYEMLSGEPPYAGMTLTELLCQHLLAPVPRLSREHGDWQALLDAMLAKDPRRRPADGQAVLEQFQHVGRFVFPPGGQGRSNGIGDPS